MAHLLSEAGLQPRLNFCLRLPVVRLTHKGIDSGSVVGCRPTAMRCFNCHVEAQLVGVRRTTRRVENAMPPSSAYLLRDER